MPIIFVKSNQPGRLGVKTPFSKYFVAEMNKKVPTAKWNGMEQTWFYGDVAKAVVEELVEKHYGGPTGLYRVEWLLDRDTEVVIDGRDLILVSRDEWNWRKTDIDFVGIEQRLSTGGSRANPTISGKLIIEGRIREKAFFDPEPISIVKIEELAPVPNAVLDIQALETEKTLMIQRVRALFGIDPMSDTQVILAALVLTEILLASPVLAEARERGQADGPLALLVKTLDAFGINGEPK